MATGDGKKKKMAAVPAVATHPAEVDELVELKAEERRQEIEERKLRIEALRYQVENERARREQILRVHRSNQDSIDQTNRDIIARQKDCHHRKGGKGLKGILNGHDSNYSIVKHTYPWGQTDVICTRCSREWKKPDPALANSNVGEYKRRMLEYTEAMNWPTDNEPSGSVLFSITRTGPQAEATQ